MSVCKVSNSPLMFFRAWSWCWSGSLMLTMAARWWDGVVVGPWWASLGGSKVFALSRMVVSVLGKGVRWWEILGDWVVATCQTLHGLWSCNGPNCVESCAVAICNDCGSVVQAAGLVQVIDGLATSRVGRVGAWIGYFCAENWAWAWAIWVSLAAVSHACNNLLELAVKALWGQGHQW